MYRTEDVNRSNKAGKSVFLALMAIAALCMSAPLAAFGQIPGAVFSQAGGIGGVDSYNSTVSHVAADSRGDVIVGAVGSSTASIEEYPAGSTTPVTLVSGLSVNGNVGIALDAAGNIYAADPGDVAIIFIPLLANGTYPSGAAYSSLTYCASGNFPFASSSQTTACTGFHYLPSAYGYYLQFIDVGFDGSGNMYTLSKYTGGTTSSTGYANGQNMILEWSASSGASTLLADNLPSEGGAEIAVDKAGDIYYVDATNSAVQYMAAGSTAILTGTTTDNVLPSTFGTGFTLPTGVTVDVGGNVYVTDKTATSLVVFPSVSGVVSAADQYTLSNTLSTGYTSGPDGGVAVDGYGRVSYGGNYPNSLNYATFGQASMGATAIGSTSGAQVLNVLFPTGANFGSFGITGPFAQTNTCTVGASTACTVSVTYTPTAAGPQTGTLVAYDGSNNVLGVATLSGSGQAATLDVDPATVAAVGSGWTAPSAIAVDAAGNTYVADSTTGKIYETAPGGTTPTVVASGFSSPSAVAIDGAGNLYVGDAGNHQVVEVPYASGAYGTPVVLVTGLSGASGLALDQAGNLYVADSGNARVLLLSRSANLSLGSLITTVGSGWTTPVALAVDNAGNLYVADAGTNKVVQLVLATGAQTTILSGLKAAAGVAVDAGGSLYAVDTNSGTVTRVPNVSGALVIGQASTLATVVAAPGGIAVDASGNVYATDTADKAVGELNRSAGLLDMGTLNVDVASGAIAAQVSDGGTAALVFNTPYAAISGSGTASFDIQNSSTCTDAATVNPGADCTVAAIFTPQASGPESETLTFGSNALNSSTLLLSGMGGSLSPTTLGVAVTAPTGTPNYGQSVTVTATVSPSTGPTGTVTFYVDTVAQTPSVSLSGGMASITLSSLTGGAHTVSATYNGDSAYASSNSSLNLTVAVAPTVTSTVGLSATPTLGSNPTSAIYGSTITMSATIAPTPAGTPTGTITFMNGTQTLGSGTVGAAQVNGAAGGTASFTTSTLQAETYSITAIYSGDSNYAGSTSASATALQVVAPPAGATTAILSNLSYYASVNSAVGLATADYQASTGHLAANARGDVFYVAHPFSNAAAYLAEIPASGGAAATVELLSNVNQNYASPGVYADSKGNLWMADTGASSIVYVPFENGTYATNVSASALSNCTLPVSTNTVACDFPWNISGSSLGGYVQSIDLALDGSGNLYVMEKYDNVTTGNNNRILEFSGSTGNLINVVVDNLASAANAQIAVDAGGDIFYANGTGVYEFSAASLPTTTGVTAAVSLGTGLSSPSGVALDAAGNLYISDTGNDRVVEIPLENNTLSSSSQYTLIDANHQSGSNTNTDAQFGAAVDGYGNIYYAGQYGNSINRIAVDRLALGGTPIGTATGTATFDVYFLSPETFGSFAVAGGAGSTVPFAVSTTGCTAGHAYTTGQTCPVALTYTATAAGLQPGQIQVLDNSSNVLGQAALSGTGEASIVNVDPSTVSALGSTWTAPSAIAVDANGNTYVADSTTGDIYETAAGDTSSTVVAGGFSTPTAVVVDGIGNLYVGDSGNTRVMEVPYVSGSYGSPVVLVTGLKGASGLGLDGLGDLYIADSGNGRVLQLAHASNGQAQSLLTQVGTGFTTPIAVAVDNSGNLYVSDAGTNQVMQVNLSTGVQTTILNGLSAAAGVAVDAGGNLYAADAGSGEIYRVPSIGGVINLNYETTLGAVVKAPVAIAVDSNGNLYAADTANAAVAESNRSAGLLNFGNVNENDVSAAVSANVSNGGTTAMTLSTPYDTISGSGTAYFSLQNTTTCVDGATINPGAACGVAATFAPTTTGLQSETLAFASSAQNSASLMLSGNGTNLITSTLGIAVTSPSGTPAYGQPVTVSATLTPTTMGGSAPTGTVIFYVDTVPQPAVTLSGDTASITLSSLVGGGHVLSASYSGDNNYASSASSNLDITITTATTTISNVAITAPYVTPTAANPNSSVTFTATLTQTGPGTPTGTVTFWNGSTNLGSAPVQSDQAVFTTNSLAAGSYNITATYSGDANFTGSTSAATASLLISTPTVTVAASTLNITGDGTPVTLSVNGIAGFGGSSTAPSTVVFACSGLPQYATCSFTPAFATPISGTPALAANPDSISFGVVVNQPPPIAPTPAGFAGIPGRPGLSAAIALCLLLPGAILAFSLKRARRLHGAIWRLPAVLLLFLAGCIGAISGCGTSNAAFTTPSGTSTITVTATITPTTAAPNPPAVQTLQFALTVNK